jgi:hypothetical protein
MVQAGNAGYCDHIAQAAFAAGVVRFVYTYGPAFLIPAP